MSVTLNIKKSVLKTTLLILIALVLASCGTRKLAVSRYETGTIQNDILTFSKKYLGKPYRYSGKGPNAFDCSGFTSFVFKNFGYHLNSSSAGQDRQVPTIAKREDLRKGDLVFFEGRGRNGRVGHVGIVSELLPSGQFKFIHASTTSGVIVSASSEPYYAQRYLRGGRVLEENAAYVTRQNPATARQKRSVQLLATDPSNPLAIPEVSLLGENGKSPTNDLSIILVQADPQKNQPLGKKEHDKSEKRADTLLKTNSDVVLRENGTAIPPPPRNHIVQSGETLYSISKQYGCSVDQLKDWNPILDTVLKAGETLLIYTSPSE